MSTSVVGPGGVLDEMVLQVGSNRYTGWESVSVMRSAESCPNSFIFSGAEANPNSATAIIAPPGSRCTILCGGDTVITGWVDRYDIQVGPNQHQVTISGRGLCEDLVDCSADLLKDLNLAGAQIAAPNVLNLAQRLCAAFKIKAMSIPTDLGPTILTMQIAIGETPYEIIERAARYAGFLLYENEFGVLVLDRVGTLKMQSGFTMPGNIESAQAQRSIDQRYSEYSVVWSAVDQYRQIGEGFVRATKTDPHMAPRYRPKLIVSEQISPGQDIAQARANWECARRIGRSQAINLTCDSWRDTASNLWRPNRLAPIVAPAMKIPNATWIIGSVTFRKDASGTHADLVLMPPDAFMPEPEPLNLWDQQTASLLPGGSHNPAPSGTGVAKP